MENPNVVRCTSCGMVGTDKGFALGTDHFGCPNCGKSGGRLGVGCPWSGCQQSYEADDQGLIKIGSFLGHLREHGVSDQASIEMVSQAQFEIELREILTGHTFGQVSAALVSIGAKS